MPGTFITRHRLLKRLFLEIKLDKHVTQSELDANSIGKAEASGIAKCC